jgi:hypothetical protein
MTYPTLISATPVTYATGTTVAYPATTAGHLMALFTIGTYNTGEPGWTIINQVFSGAFYLTLSVKVATGSESGSLTLAGSCYGRSMFTINVGTATPLPDANSTYTTGADTPDPPSLTPSFGADDCVWIVYGFQSANFTSGTIPTGGWNLLTSDGTGTSKVVIAYRLVNTGTYDPSAFNDSDAGTGNAYAMTAAFRFSDLVAANPLFFGSNF